MSLRVVAVAQEAEHGFSKRCVPEIHLIEGQGVAGDAHCGVTVQHLSRIAKDPSQPNLRQVHLIALELYETLAQAGFDLGPGSMGENVTTQGLDIMALPRGTRMTLGETEIELTGLRNPCAQIEAFRPGLLAQVLEKGPEGRLIRKAGVMGVVLRGGRIAPGDTIAVTLPAEPHERLERV